MTTVVKGARATNSGIASSKLIIQMGDLYKLPDTQGGMYVTAASLSKKKVPGYETNWHTKELRPKFDAVNNGGGYTAADTSIVVDNGSFFQKKDLVKVTRTKEVMMVTNVSTNTLTVTRSWGGTAAAAIVDNDELYIVSSAYPENAELEDGRTVTEVKYSNLMQIFRDNFEISDTLKAITEGGGTYHGSDVADQREDMALTHKRGLNVASLIGEKGQSGNQRSMGGIIEFITNYGAGRVNSTSAVTYRVFQTGIKTAARYTKKRLLGICSTQFAEIVNQWGDSQIQTRTGETKYGLKVMDIFTAHGDVRLMIDDCLEGTEYSQYCIILPADKSEHGIGWDYLRDTFIRKDRQAPSQDGYEEEMITEATLRMGHPDQLYLFDNANTSS